MSPLLVGEENVPPKRRPSKREMLTLSIETITSFGVA